MKGENKMFGLDKILLPGQNATIRKVVQRSDTAANYSDTMKEFMSTPSWVDMAIRASIEAVDNHLPEGLITVGHSIEITHNAPTCLGMTVTVKATLKSIDENHLLFDIHAWDEVGEVGSGTHERTVVDREAMLKKAKERWKFMVKRTF
jgi:predicted thioesterase